MNKLTIPHLRCGLRSLMYVDGHNRIRTVVIAEDTHLIAIQAECGGCGLTAFARFDLKTRHVRITGNALDLECHHKTITRRHVTRTAD